MERFSQPRKNCRFIAFTERSQRYLNMLLIVPCDVGIHFSDELFDCDGPPISWINEFRFQSTEEALTRGFIL
ncbi:hypothetical protein DSM25558_2706 [Agrobacterium sp. DSM 25558]|nr:hypothetical protein DSM25558_2706 [Agrobacterium sp. DSM 25558]